MKGVLANLMFVVFTTISCNTTNEHQQNRDTYKDVQIAGAMRDVMWKGKLSGIIQLDTINDRKGLYGLGPLSNLRGELLINNGKVFVSKVVTDSTMIVEENPTVSAPFFVYGNVTKWTENILPDSVEDIASLEKHINTITQFQKRPFVFKLKGKVDNASIHIQNLPLGTKVSSPKEAHQGQKSYTLQNELVEIIGFFSTQHKGVFTHHDSFLHMHLITENQEMMGHLDRMDLSEQTMKLYLPIQ